MSEEEINKQNPVPTAVEPEQHTGVDIPVYEEGELPPGQTFTTHQPPSKPSAPPARLAGKARNGDRRTNMAAMAAKPRGEVSQDQVALHGGETGAFATSDGSFSLEIPSRPGRPGSEQ